MKLILERSWSSPDFSWYLRDVFAKAHGLIRLNITQDFSSLKPYKATGFINLAFDLDNPFGLQFSQLETTKDS